MEATIDLSAITDLERMFERMCEGAGHEDAWKGHIPSTKAVWRLQCPMCGWYILFCEGRMAWMRSFEKGFLCNGCHRGFYMREFMITRLPD